MGNQTTEEFANHLHPLIERNKNDFRSLMSSAHPPTHPAVKSGTPDPGLIVLSSGAGPVAQTAEAIAQHQGSGKPFNTPWGQTYGAGRMSEGTGRTPLPCCSQLYSAQTNTQIPDREEFLELAVPHHRVLTVSNRGSYCHHKHWFRGQHHAGL